MKLKRIESFGVLKPPIVRSATSYALRSAIRPFVSRPLARSWSFSCLMALFEELRVDIKPAATRVLSAVAAVLRSHPTWSFQVSGLTDDVPIKSPRFQNSLELSTVRAARVVAFLVERGVARNRLCVAGYADLQSFSSDVTDGHDFNRRVEIVLAPDLADFE